MPGIRLAGFLYTARFEVEIPQIDQTPGHILRSPAARLDGLFITSIAPGASPATNR